MTNAIHIDSTARIDPSARIESDVCIGPYAIIGPGVSIGSQTRIGAYTIIEKNTVVGCGNQISSHAVIGADPQDKKYRGEESFLYIGDRNTIREFCTIHRGSGETATQLGSDNLLMAYCHVAHDAVVADHCTFANGATLGGHVEIASYATLGGLCAIHQHCRIGAYAMLAGGAMLVQDLPPYLMAQGDRARLFGINRIGLRRAGFTRTDIDSLHRAYKTLFFGGLQQGMASLLAQESTAPVGRLLGFIQQSKRGVCKARR